MFSGIQFLEVGFSPSCSSGLENLIIFEESAVKFREFRLLCWGWIHNLLKMSSSFFWRAFAGTQGLLVNRLVYQWIVVYVFQVFPPEESLYRGHRWMLSTGWKIPQYDLYSKICRAQPSPGKNQTHIQPESYRLIAATWVNLFSFQICLRFRRWLTTIFL